ncbi:MAG: hypothetical protein JXQ29_10815 [Planctomycetes bacterium]|nr:hypothetical protein [Planctomycetota bacterium]
MSRIAIPVRLALAALLVGFAAPAAPAHLGGTASIDQVAHLTIRGQAVVCVLELDMAEFPGGDLRKTMDRRRDFRIDPSEEQQGLRDLSRDVLRALTLTLDGEALRLRLVGRPEIDLGGDRTTGTVPVKVRIAFEAVLPEGLAGGAIRIENRLHADYVGFVRAHLEGGPDLRARLEEPVAEEIARYEQLNAVMVDGKVPELPRGDKPPQFRALTWTLSPGVAPAAPPAAAAPPVAGGAPSAGAPAGPSQPAFSDKQSRYFWEFFQGFGEAGTWVVLGVILMAFVYGMGHALMPGHGKAITAAFLIGNRGTVKDAIVLGLTVTATHTAAVFALGIAAEIATATVRRDRVTWWLELLSALLILGLGLFIFWRHLLALAAGAEVEHGHVHLLGGHHHHHGPEHGHGPEHEHEHAAGAGRPRHAHPHEHEHEHEHAAGARRLPHAHPHEHEHEHAAGAGRLPHAHPHEHEHTAQRPGLWQTIYLGVTGGMIPCPTGLAIISFSFQVHLLGLGLLLAAVFSLGMAGTLIAIGVFTVKGFKVAERYGSRRAVVVFRVIPVVSGAFISLLGAAFFAAVMGWVDIPFLRAV